MGKFIGVLYSFSGPKRLTVETLDVLPLLYTEGVTSNVWERVDVKLSLLIMYVSHIKTSLPTYVLTC